MKPIFTILLFLFFFSLRADWEEYTITMDSLYLDSVLIEDVLCKGDSTGSIQPTVSGGEPPYNFVWSDGSEEVYLENLFAGRYTVTISDALDSILIADFLIEEPDDSLRVSAGYSRINCTSTYQVILGSHGGTGEHMYSISRDFDIDEYQSSEWFSTGVFGTYFCKVRDENDCVAVDTLNVSPICSWKGYAKVTNESCLGAKDGIIDIIASGCFDNNQPEYWLSPFDGININGASSNFQGLSAGIYSLYSAVGNCSFKIDTIIVEGPYEDSLKTEVLALNHQNCLNDFGSVELEFSGGIEPYELRWDNIFINPQLDSISPGIYPYSLTDSINCTVNDTLEIFAKPTFSGDVDLIPDCATSPSTEIQMEELNYEPDLNFYIGEWLDEDGNFIDNTNSIGVGLDSQTFFTVSVLDTLSDCLYFDTININASIMVDTIKSDPILQGSVSGSPNSGFIDPMIMGGVRPYFYSWSTGSNDSVLNNIGVGLYLLSVRDDVGCRANFQYRIENITSTNELQNNISISPNPASDKIIIEAPFDFVELISLDGRVVANQKITSSPTIFSIPTLPNGLYFLRLVSDEGNMLTKEIVIQQE